MPRATIQELTQRIQRLEDKVKQIAEVERQARLRDMPGCPTCGMEWNHHGDTCTTNPITDNPPVNPPKTP